MVKGLLGQFSADQRTLLHLYEHQIRTSSYDAPVEVTQIGIAAAIFVQRKHISRTLKKLEDKKLIKFELRHIAGERQRKRTYELTSIGFEACHELTKHIKKLDVQKDGLRKEFSLHFPSLGSWLKILSHIDEDGVWHEQPLVSPVSEPDGDLSANGKLVEELIRRLFARAWEDGKITKDEQSLLNEVVQFWGIHPKRVLLISEEARGEVVAPEPEEIYLEMLIQALEDGEIQDEEFGLLETMRTAFGIDTSAHQRLLELAKVAHSENPHLPVYKEALKTALLDGIITDDEQALLYTLRTQFGITEDEHLELLEDIRS